METPIRARLHARVIPYLMCLVNQRSCDLSMPALWVLCITRRRAIASGE
jgi:hypothetical protein